MSAHAAHPSQDQAKTKPEAKTEAKPDQGHAVLALLPRNVASTVASIPSRSPQPSPVAWCAWCAFAPSRSGKWKKHWFVLSEHVLYYFDSPGDEKPRLILPMDSVRVGR